MKGARLARRKLEVFMRRRHHQPAWFLSSPPPTGMQHSKCSLCLTYFTVELDGTIHGPKNRCTTKKEALAA